MPDLCCGLKFPVMYGRMYGASYILYGATHTCMVRAVLVRAYSAWSDLSGSRICIPVQADLGMKMDELVSVQLCLFLFNSVFHACVYLFLIIQFFMHARSRKSYVYFRSIRVHGSACRMHPDALLGCRIPVRHWIQTALELSSRLVLKNFNVKVTDRFSLAYSI